MILNINSTRGELIVSNEKIILNPIPSILEIVFFEMPNNSEPTNERIIKDYEIDYYISGGGNVILNNKTFEISANTIMLRQPGQVCRSSPPYSCYALTLDFSDNAELLENYTRKRSGDLQPEINHPCLDIMPQYISVVSPTVYQNIFSKLYYLYHLGNMPVKEDYDTILTDLFLNCLTDSVHYINKKFHKNDIVKPELQKLCEWLRINSSRDITLQDMAKTVCLAPNYLHRIFVSQFGITPNRYLQLIRFEKACQLLTNTNSSVVSISYNCGFNCPSYFTKQFKAHFGITPKDYRNLHKL